MARRSIKTGKKNRKKYALILSAALTLGFFVLLFFAFWQLTVVPEHQIYASSENVKQGDTILVKVSGKYPAVSGYFDEKDIDFFRNGLHSDWVAFLGIDVKTETGKHKIVVNAWTEKMEKEISVESKNFRSVGMFFTEKLKNEGFSENKVAENISKTDSPALNPVLEKTTPEPYFKSSFSLPLKNVQIAGLDFGEFVKGKDYQLQHFGVDLEATTGTKVFAVNDGEVVLAKELANYGKTLVIDHGLGIFSLYLHLDKFEAAEGQFVEKNQIIGLSGNTGYSSAPHLHFSIKDNKARVNPISFIETTQEANDSFNLANVSRAFLRALGIE